LSVALLVVLVCLGFFWYAKRIQGRTADRIQAIRDSGLPASSADLYVWISTVADEENAAIPLQKAIDYHRLPSDPEAPIPYVNKVDVPRPPQPFPEEMRLATSLYLSSEEECLLKLGEAARFPECRFPLNFYTGYGTGFPHTAPLPRLQRLLCLKAVYEAEMENADAAFQALLVGARLSDACKSEPVLRSQTVRMEMHALFVDSVEQCLNRTTFSLEQLRALQEAIDEINKTDSLYTGLIGERCMYLDAMTRTSSSSGASPLARLAEMRWWADDLREHLEWEQMLTVMDSMIEASQLQPSEGLERAKRVANEVSPVNWDGIDSYTKGISSILASILCDAMESRARDASSLNCATTAIALLRYRQENGAFPSALGDLVPRYLGEMPLDCMDGLPVRCLHDESGFTVYSVGPNLKDDGGQAPDKPRQIKEKGDMPFTVRLRTGTR
jgi:hypothetical protein